MCLGLIVIAGTIVLNVERDLDIFDAILADEVCLGLVNLSHRLVRGRNEGVHDSLRTLALLSWLETTDELEVLVTNSKHYTIASGIVGLVDPRHTATTLVHVLGPVITILSDEADLLVLDELHQLLNVLEPLLAVVKVGANTLHLLHVVCGFLNDLEVNQRLVEQCRVDAHTAVQFFNCLLRCRCLDLRSEVAVRGVVREEVILLRALGHGVVGCCRCTFFNLIRLGARSCSEGARTMLHSGESSVAKTTVFGGCFSVASGVGGRGLCGAGYQARPRLAHLGVRRWCSKEHQRQDDEQAHHPWVVTGLHSYHPLSEGSLFKLRPDGHSRRLSKPLKNFNSSFPGRGHLKTAYNPRPT